MVNLNFLRDTSQDASVDFANGSNVGHMNVYQTRTPSGDVIALPYTNLTFSPIGRGFFYKGPRQAGYDLWGPHQAEIKQFLPNAVDKGGSSQEFLQYLMQNTPRAIVLANQWQYQMFQVTAQNPLADPSHALASFWWTLANIAYYLSTFNTKQACTLRTALDILMNQGGFDQVTSLSAIAIMLSAFGTGFSALDVPSDIYGKKPQVFGYKSMTHAIETNGDITFGAGIRWAKSSDPGTERYGDASQKIGELAQEKMMGGAMEYLFVPSDLTLPMTGTPNAGQLSGWLTLCSEIGPYVLAQAYFDIQGVVWPYAPGELEAQLRAFGVWWKKLVDRQDATGIPFARFRRQPVYSNLRMLDMYNAPDPVWSVVEAALYQADPVVFLQNITPSEKGRIYLQRVHDHYLIYHLTFPTWVPAPASSYLVYRKPGMIAHGIDVSDLP